MKEGSLIVSRFQAGDPSSIGFVHLRAVDGITVEDIRHWYNISFRKRERLLESCNVASVMIYQIAKHQWGDHQRAVNYAKARVPYFSDASVNDPPPDLFDPHRPIFCALQPRVDRWLRGMRLAPCTNDWLDQQLVRFGTVNSLIRAEVQAGHL